MSGPSDAYSLTAVAGGLLDEAGETAILKFDGASGALDLTLPAEELTALLSVCVALVGQVLPVGGETEHPTIPISDWRVGLTRAQALVLALAPEAGGALAFHLSREQAQGVAAALARALAVTPERAAPQAPRGH